MRKFIFVNLLILCTVTFTFSQSVPAVDENIPYLVTFGGNSQTSYGDDDYLQIFFCVVPVAYTQPFYIRVYDPDTGGDLDEKVDQFNTIINFSIYAGRNCWSGVSNQKAPTRDNVLSGYMLASKAFGVDARYNKKWYCFGPFNPSEGENVPILGGRVFKIIAQGVSGDDGNLYKYFLSSQPQENVPLEGGNFFTYKYHFRLSDDQKHISQIYPYVDDKTISIEVSNFDWDNDGMIRIFSNSKNGVLCNISGQNNWISQKFPIVEKEKNSTIEIQFIKNKTTQITNNNVVVTIKNQYGVSLPFFVVPIGGVPVYVPKIKMK